MNRTYAIGDIHGQLDKLVAAHALVAADRARTGDDAAPVVHLGDLVDRGPESAEVIEYLMAGPVRGGRWVTLKGNHDFMFTLFLRDPALRDPGLREGLTWLDPRLGGAATLASYGVEATSDRPLADVHAEAVARVPQAHLDWIAALPLTLDRTETFLVHAGIRPGVGWDAQDPTDLMWIRAGFLTHRQDFGKLVVHGHTAIEQPTHYGNRANIDTGAGYGRSLSVVVIENRVVWQLYPGGRLPLSAAPEDEAMLPV